MPASLVHARDRTRARRALRIPGRIRTQAWVSRACLPPPAAGPPSLARGFSVSCAGPRGRRPARHGRARASVNAGVGRCRCGPPPRGVARRGRGSATGALTPGPVRVQRQSPARGPRRLGASTGAGTRSHGAREGRLKGAGRIEGDKGVRVVMGLRKRAACLNHARIRLVSFLQHACIRLYRIGAA
jgi:hypothetical protein